MDEKYFVAKVTYDLLDDNTGKIKKIREEKLVKGYSVTDVEAKQIAEQEAKKAGFMVLKALKESEAKINLG